MAFAIHTLNNLMAPEPCYTYSHSIYSNEFEHSLQAETEHTGKAQFLISLRILYLPENLFLIFSQSNLVGTGLKRVIDPFQNGAPKYSSHMFLYGTLPFIPQI